MRKTIVSLSAAAIMATAAPGAQATPIDPPEAFLVFGDSLSDAGIFGFQATNGDTWAAQLGATTAPFDPTYNFAQSSARAVIGGSAPSGFSEQIDTYEAVAPFVRPETHAVVWLGGNDLLAATSDVADQVLLGTIDLTTVAGQTAANLIIGASAIAAVDAIAVGIQRLAGAGFDEITNFIVPGLPAFGFLPAFAGAPASLVAAATSASDGFNAALQGAVAGLDALPALEVEYFDTDALFADLRDGSPGNGFTNLQGNCQADGALPLCTGYIFADDIHPTEAAHTILASAFAERLPAPIPLPAGVLFALSGLGALGAMRLSRGA